MSAAGLPNQEAISDRPLSPPAVTPAGLSKPQSARAACCATGLQSAQARVLAANLSRAGRRFLARSEGTFCAFADLPAEAGHHLQQ